MGFTQFLNTLKQIKTANHVNRKQAVIRHFTWQFRKLFNLYPFQIRVSESILEVFDARCGTCALVNSMEMYDYNIMNLIKLLSEKEKNFFDIGANVGLYSLLASESNSVAIYSFEPHPGTFNQLLRNIKINNRKNINPFRMAISNFTGVGYITDKKESSLNAVVEKPDGNTISINLVSIEEFCKEYNVFPAFVKIDVEGYELKVLEGFGDKIISTKLIILEWGELNKNDSSKILDMLRENKFDGPFYFNYELRTFFREKQPNEMNVVFINDDVKQNLTNEYGLILK